MCQIQYFYSIPFNFAFLKQIYKSCGADERIMVKTKCETCNENYYLLLCEECKKSNCFCGCSKGCTCDGIYY